MPPTTTTTKLTTLPSTTQSTTTRTTTQPSTIVSTRQKYVNVDGDIYVPGKTVISVSSTPIVDRTGTTTPVSIEISTTTLPPMTEIFTTKYR